jgi:hypothetical protein
MPRSIDHVHKEIVRIADELGLDPRSREYTRGKFLQHGRDVNVEWQEEDDGTYTLSSEDSTTRPTDVTKHDLETYGGWAKLKHDAAHVVGVPPESNAAAVRGVELRNLYVRRLERKTATQEYFHERLTETFHDVFSKNKVTLTTGNYVKKKKPTRKTLTLLWSDLHFGIDVFDHEVYKSRYNWLIASRRMGMLCQDAVDWDDVQETELRIILNGDIMQGVIHLNDANIRPMTEQIWGATAILTSSLDFLRRFFGKITVVCLPGNHDRMTYKDTGRATTQRWDSHAHSVYLALKQGFRDDTGVSFEIPTTAIGLSDDMNDGYILSAHGDTEPDPRNISKKIDTERLAIKLLKLKESQAVDRKISVALFGHWHTPTIQMLPSGTWIVVNGSLIGSEPFGQNVVGEFNCQPAQIMFDSEPGRPLNKLRIVQVKEADNDKNYNKIVPVPQIISDGQLIV